jgi:hypothetical protein
MKTSNALIAFALALLTGVGCAFLTNRSGSGGGGASADADKEYHRKLDLYGVGEPCPQGGAKLWGRATRDDYGIVGMVDTTSGGKYEQTLWIGRSGEHAAALTCSGGTVVSKVLCGQMRCIPCAQTRECPAPQTCHYGRCQ